MAASGGGVGQGNNCSDVAFDVRLHPRVYCLE